MNNKIYISGPISGQEALAEERFQRAEDVLSPFFDRVVNPMKLDHDHDKSWESYMKVDIAALLDCDSIYLLKGWKKSKGARLEVEIANQLGFKTYYEI